MYRNIEKYKNAKNIIFKGFFTFSFDKITDNVLVDIYVVIDLFIKSCKEIQSCFYLYTVEIGHNGTRHFHMLLDVELSNSFYKVKKAWSYLLIKRYKIIHKTFKLQDDFMQIMSNYVKVNQTPFDLQRLLKYMFKEKLSFLRFRRIEEEANIADHFGWGDRGFAQKDQSGEGEKSARRKIRKYFYKKKHVR